MKVRRKRLCEPFTPTRVHHSLVVVVLGRGEGEGLGWGEGEARREAVGRRDAKLPNAADLDVQKPVQFN